MRDYPLIVLPLPLPLPEADGGGWLALVPDLPGCLSDGDTPAEAALNVRDAIRAWVEAQVEDHDPVPAPGEVLPLLLRAGLAGAPAPRIADLARTWRLATEAGEPLPLAVGAR